MTNLYDGESGRWCWRFRSVVSEIKFYNRLFLTRHAKSDWDSGANDFSRSLARRGVKDALKMGKWLAQFSLPELILCSPAKRTRETLEFMELGGELNLAEITEFADELYHASSESIIKCIQRYPTAGDLMVIGHNPGLEELLLLLLENNKVLRNYEKPFPTGAIYELAIGGKLRRLGRNSATLSNFMRPKLL